MSKYGFISGPYFPVFGLNTEIYGVKSNLVISNRDTKVYTNVECCYLLDINITEKINEKLEVYQSLVRNLQISHYCYKFKIAPIVVETMEYVPKCLVIYLKIVAFEGKEIKLLLRRMQVKSISGSVTIVKRFYILMILISEPGGCI